LDSSSDTAAARFHQTAPTSLTIPPTPTSGSGSAATRRRTLSGRARRQPPPRADRPRCQHRQQKFAAAPAACLGWRDRFAAEILLVAGRTI